MTYSDFDDAPSASLPDLVGRTIDGGRLRLIKCLGRGAWGVVYLATTMSAPPTLYAVKCIASGDISEEQECAIAREINLQDVCARISPYVLQVHNVIDEEEEGLTFIVTEYCEAGDLLQMIVNGTFAGRDDLIKNVFLQIIDGVASCHNAAVFHRDLKPENIMCKEGGSRIFIGDFGFATPRRFMTEFGVGSEPFMSPEVRGGFHVRLTKYSTQLADIWALGVILLNLSCGFLPWNKASVSDPNFRQYLSGRKDYFYNNFAVSTQLNDVLNRIFTTDPSKRISLVDLRKAILEMRTFGAEKSEDDAAEVVAAAVAAGYESSTDCLSDSDSDDDLTPIAVKFEKGAIRAIHPSAPAPLAALLNMDVRQRSRTSDLSDSSTDVDPLADYTQIAPRQHRPATPFRLLQSPAVLSTGSAFVIGSADSDTHFDGDGDDDSDDESEGPITPETHAVDSAVALDDVPDLPGLDDGVAASPEVIFDVDADEDVTLIQVVVKRTPEGAGFDAAPSSKDNAPPAYYGDMPANMLGQPCAKRMLWNAARMMRVPMRMAEMAE